jgi:hypothetical protein
MIYIVLIVLICKSCKNVNFSVYNFYENIAKINFIFETYFSVIFPENTIFFISINSYMQKSKKNKKRHISVFGFDDISILRESIFSN